MLAVGSVASMRAGVWCLKAASNSGRVGEEEYERVCVTRPGKGDE